MWVASLVSVAGSRSHPQLAADGAVREAEHPERQQVGGSQQEKRVRATPDGTRIRPHLFAVQYLEHARGKIDRRVTRLSNIIIIIMDLYSAYYKKRNIGATVKIKPKTTLKPGWKTRLNSINSQRQVLRSTS